jgi:hypothetical protein
MLDVRLALNGVGDSLVKLHVDESLEAITLCEAGYDPLAVFIGASTDVGGDADVRTPFGRLVMM